MPSKKGHIEGQSIAGGDVSHGVQVLHAQGVDAVRGRLEVFPQQKNPDHLHAQLGNQGKIGMDFTGFEVFPPTHGFAARPVIDAQNKWCTHKYAPCYLV